MRLRSSGKHEPFLLLNDDRKTSREWNEDTDGQEGLFYSGNGDEQRADAILRRHLCGWACSCFLTRVNFCIAGCLFVFLLYTLSETTLIFERISHQFTGLPMPDSTDSAKSLGQYMEKHYKMLCCAGPFILCALFCANYLRHYSGDINICSCGSPARAAPARKSRAPAMNAIIEEVEEEDKVAQERRDKIRNRKKTPAPKERSNATKEKKLDGRSKSKSPVKRANTERNSKKSKKSLE